jgi:hypothetical protein
MITFVSWVGNRKTANVKREGPIRRTHKKVWPDRNRFRAAQARLLNLKIRESFHVCRFTFYDRET